MMKIIRIPDSLSLKSAAATLILLASVCLAIASICPTSDVPWGTIVQRGTSGTTLISMTRQLTWYNNRYCKNNSPLWQTYPNGCLSALWSEDLDTLTNAPYATADAKAHATSCAEGGYAIISLVSFSVLATLIAIFFVLKNHVQICMLLAGGTALLYSVVLSVWGFACYQYQMQKPDEYPTTVTWDVSLDIGFYLCITSMLLNFSVAIFCSAQRCREVGFWSKSTSDGSSTSTL